MEGHNPRLAAIASLAREKGIPVAAADSHLLRRLTGGALHQGVVAQLSPAPYAEVSNLLDAAAARNEPALLVILDGVEDPHNLGAVLRTVDCAGGHGVVVPRRRSAGLTLAAARASAGAFARVPVARSSNVAVAMEQLRKAGVWLVGADSSAEHLLYEAPFTEPVAVVIGGEDKGLSARARKLCDMLVRIPMRGHINSLNASVAAAILLYEAVRQRGGAQSEAGRKPP